MSNETMQNVSRMIEKECQRNSLVELLESWDLTTGDWYDFINRGLGYDDNGYKAIPLNPPLTLEQLKQRVGKPVYGYHTKQWYIIFNTEDCSDENIGEQESGSFVKITMTDGEDFDFFVNSSDEDFYDHEPKGE